MITQWWPLAASTSMVVTITVNSVATGAVLKATINGAVVQYTCLNTDTAATAATAWFALLGLSTNAPEFLEITFANPSNGVITATAQTAGNPFASTVPGNAITTNGLNVSATGGGSVSQAITTPNSSPSDAANPLNWLRNGVSSLPQNDDDLAIANSSVPILYNGDTAFPNVRLASVTRYQNFTATVGLPEVNPNGYQEYRGSYLLLNGGGVSNQSPFSSPGGGTGGVLNVVLGFGGGSGPQRERYNFQGQQVNVQVLAAGSPLDPYSIRILGSNPANVLTVIGTTVGVAMLPGESASLATCTVTQGGAVALGPTVTFTGTLTVNGSNAAINCLVPNVNAQGGSQVSQGTVASNLSITYPSWTVQGQSTVSWFSGGSITSLNLQTQSTFDLSQTLQKVNIASLSIQVDSCTWNDPNNVSVFGSPVTLVNALASGPFIFGPGRTFQIV